MAQSMANWNKSYLMEKRLKRNGVIYKMDGVDYYQGRPIIRRDTPIDGGVSLGEGEREAIVVDSKKYHALKSLYKEATKRASLEGRPRRHMALRAVYDTVAQNLPYDEKGVRAILREFEVEQDGKIALDVFIDRHAGVCRHQALASGALIEMFKGDGIVRGKPSIDRNSMERGGHAWCRYTANDGGIQILDVAQNFFGGLEEAMKQGRWEYNRQDDVF